MSINFHDTSYGRAFFSHQLPELIKGINRLADQIERYTDSTMAVDNPTAPPSIVLVKSKGKVQKLMTDDRQHWVGQEVLVTNHKCGRHDTHMGMISEIHEKTASVVCGAMGPLEIGCGVVKVPYSDLKTINHI